MKRRTLIILVVLGLLAVIAVGIGWPLYVQLQKEQESMAMFSVTGAIGRYVDDHNQWPPSWEDLEIAGSSRSQEFVRKTVTVNWDVSLAEIAAYDPMNDSASPPFLVRFADGVSHKHLLEISEQGFNEDLASMISLMQRRRQQREMETVAPGN